MQQSVLHPLNAQSRVKMVYSASHTPDATDLAFDMDSFKVGVNASTTMSGNKDLFEDLVLKDLGGCKGVGGELAIASIGTSTIKMNDDIGRTHLVQIPNSIYMPNLQMTLLCPQYLTQQDVTSHPWSLDGTVCNEQQKQWC